MKIVANNVYFKGSKDSQLNNINFTVNHGECLVISGISGCGKSLLHALICGLVNANSGSVTFDDLTMQQMTFEQDTTFRRDFGVMFQEPALLSNLTVHENLNLPLNQHYPELTESERNSIIEKTCQQFNLDRYLDERAEELSTGLRQVASFTRALVYKPKFIIWDAPLADIDLQWSEKIIGMLNTMKGEKVTMILFTNKKKIINDLADIHLHMVDGELLSSNAYNLNP